MKVLLLGATGNLGSCILPALLTHGHSVIAYVRSSNKLQALLPEYVHHQITVIQGDATDVALIKRAILDLRCDAVVTAAGLAAMPRGFGKDIPVYLEHRENVALLKALPPDTVEWSMLCPGNMASESSEIIVPTKSPSKGGLVAASSIPPLWEHSWVRNIPAIGKTIEIALNFSRYDTTLEQNAEFIAADLEESHDSRFIGKTVGVMSGSK